MSIDSALAAGPLPDHIAGRKATWFELFYDLVFVVAVAQLAGRYAAHYHWRGTLLFTGTFVAMWWCWLGHTFHSTCFDQDLPRQRLVGFAQIGAVALLGYGVADPVGTRAWAFGGGLSAFKLLLALAYLSERHWTGAAVVIRVYALLYGVQAALWLAGSVAEGGRWPMWGLALTLDLVSPWLLARQRAAVPPHPDHLPERFGLFTIILLGEWMASVVRALDHGETLHRSGIGVAILGALLTCALWLAYFDRVQGHGARHVGHAAGRGMRLWAYGHLPLYMGIASLAAGTVAMSEAGSRSLGHVAIYLEGVLLVGGGLLLLRRARVGSAAAVR